LLGLAGGFGVLCSAEIAFADAASRAAADKLYAKGSALIRDGKQAEGCAIVQQSVDIEASVTAEEVLINCDKDLHRVGRAALRNRRRTLDLTAALKVTSDPDRRARLEKALQDTQARSVALEPKLAALPRLTLVLPAGAKELADLVVEIDGIALAASAWTVPIAVDLGHHVVKARAKGKRPFTVEFDVTTGPASVMVDLIDEPPVTQTPAIAPTGSVAPAASVRPTGSVKPTGPVVVAASSPWVTGREIGIGAGLAVGLVGVAIGVGFGAAFVEARDAYPRDCARGAEWCRDGTSSDKRYQDAINLRTTETTAFIVGGVGIGAAALLRYFVAGAPVRSARSPTPVTVSVGPGGVRVTGSF